MGSEGEKSKPALPVKAVKKESKAEKRHRAYIRCVPCSQLHRSCSNVNYRNREKNVAYQKAWNALHRGPGTRRKVAKDQRIVGLGRVLPPSPVPDCAPSESPPPFLPDHRSFGLQARPQKVGGWPAEWSQEDRDFYLQ